jgi:hypothetical protein
MGRQRVAADERCCEAEREEAGEADFTAAADVGLGALRYKHP